MFELKKQEEILFNVWEKAYPDKKIFIKDGIVSENDWNESPQKILFVLKEAYFNTSTDLREKLQKGMSAKTFGNISRWSYAIKNSDKVTFPNWDIVKKRGNKNGREKHLKTICLINLNKFGGKSRTKKSDLINNFKYFNKSYLQQQLELYLPKTDIIICCGKTIVSTLFQELLDCKNKCLSYSSNNNIKTYSIEYSNRTILLIDFYHPQQSKMTNEKLYSLLVNTISMYNSQKK